MQEFSVKWRMDQGSVREVLHGYSPGFVPATDRTGQRCQVHAETGRLLAEGPSNSWCLSTELGNTQGPQGRYIHSEAVCIAWAWLPSVSPAEVQSESWSKGREIGWWEIVRADQMQTEVSMCCKRLSRSREEFIMVFFMTQPFDEYKQVRQLNTHGQSPIQNSWKEINEISNHKLQMYIAAAKQLLLATKFWGRTGTLRLG